MKNKRIAEMNHDAVNWAKIWNGPVYYFSRSEEKHIDIENPIFVEVGKWTSAGAERISEDFFCSYYAALLLGYKSSVHGLAWLPASHDKSGDRKYLIGKGYSKDGIYQSLSMTEARIIASKINLLMVLAKLTSLKMLYFDKNLKPLLLETLFKIRIWILEIKLKMAKYSPNGVWKKRIVARLEKEYLQLRDEFLSKKF